MRAGLKASSKKVRSTPILAITLYVNDSKYCILHNEQSGAFTRIYLTPWHSQLCKGGFKLKKCKWTLAMSPACYSNSPLPIYGLFINYDLGWVGKLNGTIPRKKETLPPPIP